MLSCDCISIINMESSSILVMTRTSTYWLKKELLTNWITLMITRTFNLLIGGETSYLLNCTSANSLIPTATPNIYSIHISPSSSKFLKPQRLDWLHRKQALQTRENWRLMSQRCYDSMNHVTMLHPQEWARLKTMCCGLELVGIYSLRPRLIVILWLSTDFKKCREKLVKIVSGMWDPFFFILVL